jgi:hypothetical protein
MKLNLYRVDLSCQIKLINLKKITKTILFFMFKILFGIEITFIYFKYFLFKNILKYFLKKLIFYIITSKRFKIIYKINLK